MKSFIISKYKKLFQLLKSESGKVGILICLFLTLFSTIGVAFSNGLLQGKLISYFVVGLTGWIMQVILISFLLFILLSLYFFISFFFKKKESKK